MITTPKFVIGHIPKTGGDAVKQICAAVFETGLEHDYSIDSLFSETKHRGFSGDEPCRVLGIRRLPAYALSHAYHRHILGGERLWTPDKTVDVCNADAALKEFTQDFKLDIRYWIRQEFLRDDLIWLFRAFYPAQFSARHRHIINNCPTKSAMTYNHDVSNFFTTEHIYALYERNPRWAELEQELYTE